MRVEVTVEDKVDFAGGILSHAEGLASTNPLEELHTLSIRPSMESSSVHLTS